MCSIVLATFLSVHKLLLLFLCDQKQLSITDACKRRKQRRNFGIKERGKLIIYIYKVKRKKNKRKKKEKKKMASRSAAEVTEMAASINKPLLTDCSHLARSSGWLSQFVSRTTCHCRSFLSPTFPADWRNSPGAGEKCRISTELGDKCRVNHLAQLFVSTPFDFLS